MGEPSSSWQNFNFRDDEGSAQGMQALRLLLAKLQEAQANPCLKPSVNNLLMTEDLMLTSTQRLPSSVAPMHLEGGEGVPVMHGPMQANVVPHPLQGPLQTDGAKKKQYHGQERHVGKIREEGDFHDEMMNLPLEVVIRRGLMSDAPRDQGGTLAVALLHPLKVVVVLMDGFQRKTFDGSYGHVDKVLTFIQQFDAAFGGEDFTEASKLRNVAMHLTKSARHWWSTLCAKNQAPKTWKVCRLTIMKQFLDDDAEDNVLTAWRSLKFKEGESLQNYIEKFWDTCLKATVYRNINFSEKRQQFCAGLPEDMRTYVQALRPKTIAAVIHYTRVAYKIFKPKNPPNKGDKGKDKENGSSNVKSNNKKQASKRPYQGTNRLSPEEMERYRKENRCFRCGTTDVEIWHKWIGHTNVQRLKLMQKNLYKVCHSSEFVKYSKHTPQQNGVAKCKNKHITEVVRALMSEKNMPPCYWAEAASIAAVHDMTLEEKFIGKKPDVSHFKVFGCTAYVQVPNELRTKC
ncbi:hypothetical protein L7F22_011978 [Adiantum nelumboides]|nr:hypothetical protein [Adiantum nelumboides]